MAQLKINIPLFIQTTNEGHGQHGFFHYMTSVSMEHYLEGIEYGSEGQIKTKLRKRAEAQILEALQDQEQRSGRVFGCGDGTVFVAFFRGGQWHAGIYGPDRKHGGYTVGGKDLETVSESIRKHAADCFGGVKWETGL